MFHAVQWNNCSGDWVFTILLRQTSSFAFHVALLFSKHLNLSVALPGSYLVCTNANEIVSLVVHWRTFVWQSRIMVGRLDQGREREERERVRERAPGKLPWLCLQQKAIVWCGRTAGSKAPAPTGCALGKMPDGGHCWMTSTSPYWDSEQSPPEASGDSEKYIKQQQFDAFSSCARNICLCLSVQVRCLGFLTETSKCSNICYCLWQIFDSFKYS